jgi:hypothetical protein
VAELRPVYDRWSARRLDSAGGRVRPEGAGREITPGLVDGRARELSGSYSRDALILRDRTAVYDFDSYRAAGSLVDWTMSGPIRRSLWVRNESDRRQAGTDNTRAQDPTPIATYGSQDGTMSKPHGMHTTPISGRVLSSRTYQASGRAQMTAARYNRLADAVYQGQSYSQTTRVQGG